MGRRGAGGKRVSPTPEEGGARQAAKAKLAKLVMEDLLRAGPTATREALQSDPTLATFLDPSNFARLAEYARPRPLPRRRVKAGVDVLKTMAPRQSIWGRLASLAVRLFIFATLVWLTYRGVLRIAR